MDPVICPISVLSSRKGWINESIKIWYFKFLRAAWNLHLEIEKPGPQFSVGTMAIAQLLPGLRGRDETLWTFLSKARQTWPLNFLLVIKIACDSFPVNTEYVEWPKKNNKDVKNKNKNKNSGYSALLNPSFLNFQCVKPFLQFYTFPGPLTCLTCIWTAEPEDGEPTLNLRGSGFPKETLSELGTCVYFQLSHDQKCHFLLYLLNEFDFGYVILIGLAQN